MDWDDSRIFLAFAREGSFSKAAHRLGVRHSTVSRRIRALEEKLATPLVERSATGYVLTEDGMALERAARRIERELLQFEATRSGGREELAGELRVTAIANMASGPLMPAFARFVTAFPNIRLELRVSNTSVHLSQRDADIALRQTNSPQETLIGTRLLTVASTVYGSRAHSAGRGHKRWIGVDCCDFHRSWTRAACPEADHPICVDDTALTIAAIKEGLGVGFLPCFLGDSDPDLVRLRAPDPGHDVGLWLLYHRDLRNTRRVILFREHMQREVQPLQALFAGRQAPAAPG